METRGNASYRPEASLLSRIMVSRDGPEPRETYHPEASLLSRIMASRDGPYLPEAGLIGLMAHGSSLSPAGRHTCEIIIC